MNDTRGGVPVPNRKELGRLAEDRAAEYLLSLGYSLITRRWKRAGGEIDLVAMDGETLVFVEVKATLAAGFRPEAAFSDTKVARLLHVSEQYVREYGLHDRPLRVDLVAVDASGLRHYPDVLRDSV
ncbi:MAG: YraN family protein [Fimbriimonadaceae bacterium]|nr:YraN family protein [Fimbriimonadaceae bacterium]